MPGTEETRLRGGYGAPRVAKYNPGSAKGRPGCFLFLFNPKPFFGRRSLTIRRSDDEDGFSYRGGFGGRGPRRSGRRRGRGRARGLFLFDIETYHGYNLGRHSFPRFVHLAACGEVDRIKRCVLSGWAPPARASRNGLFDRLDGIRHARVWYPVNLKNRASRPVSHAPPGVRA